MKSTFTDSVKIIFPLSSTDAVQSRSEGVETQRQQIREPARITSVQHKVYIIYLYNYICVYGDPILGL